MSDILQKPRSGLLSTGFFLAMYFSSNAVMGIMRSFDKQYVGFIKRKGLAPRWIALKLTSILFILFFLCLSALIMQGQVLKWFGIKNFFLIAVINDFGGCSSYCFSFILFPLSIAGRRRVHKKWKFISPGSILATFLMIVFTAGFSYYVSNFSNYNELYGSISTVLILMLLIYFNSLVLLIGFELNVSITSLKHEVDERKKKLASGNHPV